MAVALLIAILCHAARQAPQNDHKAPDAPLPDIWAVLANARHITQQAAENPHATQ